MLAESSLANWREICLVPSPQVEKRSRIRAVQFVSPMEVDLRTTLVVYAHGIPDTQRESMEQIAKHSIATKLPNETRALVQVVHLQKVLVGTVGIEPGRPSNSKGLTTAKPQNGMLQPCWQQTNWCYGDPIAAFCRFESSLSTCTPTKSTV